MEKMRLELLNLEMGLSRETKSMKQMDADLLVILCSSSHFLSRQRKSLSLGRLCAQFCFSEHFPFRASTVS